MKVAILGMGPSADAYARHAAVPGGRKSAFDETWTVNAFGSVFQADRIFHMDDVRIQELRVKAGNKQIENMLKWMRDHKGPPIYTSRTHPDYPALVEYPLETVMSFTGGPPYFTNTMPYAIAYAMAGKRVGLPEDVDGLALFGCDYAYSSKQKAEEGRSCCEYWLGRAHERGIQIALPQEAWLLNVNKRGALYGYDTREVSIVANDNGDGCKVTYSEKPPPTAEEVEAIYAH